MFLKNINNTSVSRKLALTNQNVTILVCMVILCCLRTCSYLLGNKGTHMYNGNPNGNGDQEKAGLLMC